MPWIQVYLPQILCFIAGLAIAGGVVFVWMKAKWRLDVAQLSQEFSTQAQLHEQHQRHLQEALIEQQAALKHLEQTHDAMTQERHHFHHQLAATNAKLEQQEGTYHALKVERIQLQDALTQAREQQSQLQGQLREQEARHQAQMQSSQEKLQLLERAEERLKQQFEQLANQLFEAKTAKVDQQNKQSLEGLLNPLKLQLEGFKKQVTDSFNVEAKERHTLVHELKNLQRLNEQMAQEAVNLTQALKGDNKQQGNWGEVVLARILDESGLREGHEYLTQTSLQNEEGKRYQPDVIVNLPNDKQVVIDSKMALVAYERYFHAESDADRARALSEHLVALRSHIKELSRKDYQQLQGIHTLDYVLMFVPVEPAFQTAIQADPSLVKDAMEQNIIIVSPTTLLVALRTIDNLWRNEYQNQNAQLIAVKASKLYDKLRLFVDDMEMLGASLGKANKSYEEAMKKLVSGRGNAIRQAEGFKKLGVEVKKSIATKRVEEATQDLPEDVLEDQSLQWAQVEQD